MDDSRKPDSSAPAGPPWQMDESSGENFGATSIFAAMPKSPQVREQEDPADRNEISGNAAQIAVPGGRNGLEEPIVHKVVLGRGAATGTVDLLELLRADGPKVADVPAQMSADPQGLPLLAGLQPVVAKSPEPPARQPSEGFTQLLRALGGDASPASAARPPAPVQRTAASSGSSSTSPESGFTALVRASNTDSSNEQPEKRPDLRTSSPAAMPADGAAGFTALLQGFPTSPRKPSAPQADSTPFDESTRAFLPAVTPTPPSIPAPVYPSGQATPGTFTQLFSTLPSRAVETKPDWATPAALPERNSANRPSGEETSFTQMMSALGETPQKASTYRDSRPPVQEQFSPEPSWEREEVQRSSQFPSGVTGWSSPARPQAEASSSASPSSSGDAGLTQILRTLRQPAREPEAPIAYSPPPAAAPAGGSLFTQTYQKLDAGVEPPPPAPQPAYSPPSNLSATQPFASPLSSGAFPGQVPAAPAAQNLPVGPSDVTRILDASRLREMQRGGQPAPGPVNPGTPAQFSPPQMPVPVPPAAPSLQWQPPPAPMPMQPPQMSAAMQVPQYTPPAPKMPAPAAPPAMGKLQQYLPLMLIAIIFLLVVILVTVIFLLKH